MFLQVAETRTRLVRKIGNKAPIAPPQRRSSNWLLVNRKKFESRLQIVESSELLHSKSAFFPCTHDRDCLNCSVEGLNFGNTFSS